MDSPAKMLERFERAHGTYRELISKLLHAEDDIARKWAEKRLDWHSRIRRNVVMYDLGYAAAVADHDRQGKEDK